MSRTDAAATNAAHRAEQERDREAGVLGQPVASTCAAMITPAICAPIAEPMLRMIVFDAGRLAGLVRVDGVDDQVRDRREGDADAGEQQQAPDHDPSAEPCAKAMPTRPAAASSAGEERRLGAAALARRGRRSARPAARRGCRARAAARPGSRRGRSPTSPPFGSWASCGTSTNVPNMAEPISSVAMSVSARAAGERVHVDQRLGVAALEDAEAHEHDRARRRSGPASARTPSPSRRRGRWRSAPRRGPAARIPAPATSTRPGVRTGDSGTNRIVVTVASAPIRAASQKIQMLLAVTHSVDGTSAWSTFRSRPMETAPRAVDDHQPEPRRRRWYMLFATDELGIPSVASWVKIGNPTDEPRRSAAHRRSSPHRPARS